MNIGKHLRPSLILILLTSTQYLSASSDSPKREKLSYHLPYIEQTVKIDGVMDESVWEHSLKVELNYETSPGENIRPSVKTEVFLFENGKTLYIAFNALDSNPEQIRDYLLDRDNIWSSDFVGIKFDTFGESRKAFQFFTNANGIQADAIQEDFRGDDSSWDAIWESSAKINANGYMVEMAIPFQAFRFPATGKTQSWGFELLRFLPRNTFHRIANTPVERSIACQICQFDQLVGFSKIQPSKNLRLIPTLTLGQDENRSFDDSGQASNWQKDDTNTSFGLDLRWGITQETYLNATLNPDFSQVEADSAQLDVNNTFSIFLNEKRPFFLDGSDYFNSPNRLVHTRDLISPEYGLKITGQTNNHSYGVISVKDESTSFLLPGNQGSSLIALDNLESENQIFRYSYDLGNKNNIGTLITDKRADDYSNQVISVDGEYWFDQAHTISFQIMSSESHYSPMMVADYELEESDIDDNAYFLKYDYRTRNWIAKVRYVEFGKDFRADLGFIGKVDFSRTAVGMRRIWYPEGSELWWNRYSFGADWDKTHDSEGKLLEEEIKASFRLQANYQSVFNFGLGAREREWDGIYYDEDFFYFFAALEPLAGFKLNIRFRWGASIDFANSQLGDSNQISPGIDWQVNQHILTSLRYSKRSFDVGKQRLFSESATNLRASYLFDQRSTLRLTLQLRDIQKDPTLYNTYDNGDPTDDEQNRERFLATQLLYSYKINPQTLFFAGYSDNGFQNDNQTEIEKEKRSVFMKFSYAWQM